MDEKKFINKVYLSSMWAVTLSVLLVQICSIINNIVVGNLVGDRGLSVMSLVSPVGFAFATVGSLMAVGGSILAARSIGMRDTERSNACLLTVLTAVLAIGGLLTVLGMIFVEPLMSLLNVGDELRHDAKQYLLAYLPCAVGAMGIYVPFNFLKITGGQKYSVYLFGAMAVTNIALDFLFAGVCGMGIAGIGLATTLGNWVGFAPGVAILYSKKGGYRFTRRKGQFGDLGSIFAFGSPSAANNLCNLFRSFFFNLIIVTSLGNVGLPAFSIISTVFSFAVVTFNGSSMSMAQFVAVFSAEKDIGAQKQVFRTALWTGAVITAVIALATGLFPETVCDIFSVSDPATRTVAVRAIRLFALSLVPALVNNVLVMFHQINGHMVLANLLTVLHAFALVVGAAFGLSRAPDPEWMWLSFFAAETVTLILALVIPLIMSEGNRNVSRILLIDTYTVRTGKAMSFSLGTDNNEATACSDQVKEFCEEHGLSMKTAMTLGLAIEEIVVSFNENALSGLKKPGKTHVRILIYDGSVILRFRTGGRIYDPIAASENDDDMMSLSVGIKLVKGLAKTVSYNRVFGVNNLVISV